jgi:hypothetical protein
MAAAGAISTFNNSNVEAIGIELRPYNRKELVALYGISLKTLNKWLKPFEQKIGRPNGRYYTITQVKIIFSYLGFPSVMYDKI